MRLLHGMTDALTPENLFPNSDFTQHWGGGNGAWNVFPYTVTPKTNGNSTMFSSFWYFKCYQAANLNYTVTVNRNKLSVLGSHSGGAPYLYPEPYTSFVYSGDSFKDVFTIVVKATNKGSIPVIVNGDTAGNNISYYSNGNEVKPGETKTVVRVYGLASQTNDIGIFFNYVNLSDYGKEISIDIEDVALFEGAYTNPPVGIRSRDVRKSTPFAIEYTPTFDLFNTGEVVSYCSLLNSSRKGAERVHGFHIDGNMPKKCKIRLFTINISNNANDTYYGRFYWGSAGVVAESAMIVRDFYMTFHGQSTNQGSIIKQQWDDVYSFGNKASSVTHSFSRSINDGNTYTIYLDFDASQCTYNGYFSFECYCSHYGMYTEHGNMLYDYALDN